MHHFNATEWSTSELRTMSLALAIGEALDLAAGDHDAWLDRRAQRNACEAELSTRGVK